MTGVTAHQARRPGAAAPGAASRDAVDWHAINWRKAHRLVRRLQVRIVQATQAGRWGKAKALQRLLTRGWIEDFEEDETSRDRRAYRLTARGRRNLQIEVDRMKQLTKVANLRIARK